MKTSTYLLLAVIACAKLSDAYVYAEEIDDTLASTDSAANSSPSPTYAPIICDGNVTCDVVYDPVCTSNNLTFSNPCQFKNAYCEQPRDTFFIIAKGPCTADTEVFAQTADVDDEQPITIAPSVFDVPVTLDDGHEVTNPVVVDGDGLEAPIGDAIPVEGGGHSEEPSAPVIDCSSGDLMCDEPYDPVCTSTGVTFINWCQFRNAYCEAPSEAFFVASKGPCDRSKVVLQVQSVDDEVWARVFNVPVDLDLNQDQTTDAITQPSASDCDDGRIECGPEHDPVCASDGRTFRNACEFKNVYCERPDARLRIASKAPCKDNFQAQSTDEDGVSQDVLNYPVELDEVEVETDVDTSVGSNKLSQYCTLVCPIGAVTVTPLCGTDSRSYINDCHLLSSKCEQPELEKQYDGLCIMGQVPVARSTTGASLTTQEAARPKCNPHCGKSYAPVCGSNGVTYANECLLAFATCQDPRVTKLGPGACSELFGKSYGAKKASSSCVPSVCPGTDAPVCGSDGETYLNVCMLENAKCLIPELTMVHEGECGLDTILTCATLTCPRYQTCLEASGPQPAHCADVCHADRCGPNETCKLLSTSCYTAPCSPVATCVPSGNTTPSDIY